MTDTVRAAYLVAAAHVAEHGPTEQALEAAVDLGSMSGTWALVLARREAVYADQLAAIVKAWRKLARRADLKAAVHRVRHNLGLEEMADPERRQRTAEAAAAAVLALHLLVNQSDPDWAAFVDALAAGMTVAQAEGVAGAVGVAAEQAGITGIDFQRAYDDALAAPGGTAADARHAAEMAATTILRGATTDLTSALAAGVRDELTAAEMEALAADAIGLDDGGDGEDGAGSAAYLLGDVALGKSVTAGILGWLVANSVRMVDFVTVGGACLRCLDIEAGNPWPAYSVPSPPIHPYCRCSVTSTDTVFGFDFTRYL